MTERILATLLMLIFFVALAALIIAGAVILQHSLNSIPGY